MGLSLTVYSCLAITGAWMFYRRRSRQKRPPWLRRLHYGLGGVMVTLVLVLLMIGLVGTLGHYGSLGHSIHLPAGLLVVSLVLLSAWSATRISPKRPWAYRLHIGLNGLLFGALVLVSLTGWTAVQKYLP